MQLDQAIYTAQPWTVLLSDSLEAQHSRQHAELAQLAAQQPLPPAVCVTQRSKHPSVPSTAFAGYLHVLPVMIAAIAAEAESAILRRANHMLHT